MSAPVAKYITKCLICGHEFQASAFDIPIIGQPSERLITFAQALMKHLGKHAEQMGAFAGALQECSYLLCVRHFEMQDPQLLRMAEYVRARAHRFTRKNEITNATIDDRLAQLPIPLDIIEPLTALFQDMRDILSEEGKYAPKPPEKPLVTP